MEFDHQGVLVENGEPEKAAEEAHKTRLDIWAAVQGLVPRPRQ